MTIIPTFLIFLIGIFSSLVLTSFGGAQSQAHDVTMKSDINSTYQKLEESFNEHGYYPTENAVENSESSGGRILFPGIDSESLSDRDGKWINKGNYSYRGYDCSSTECRKYSLSAKLEDGTTYTKNSLN